MQKPLGVLCGKLALMKANESTAIIIQSIIIIVLVITQFMISRGNQEVKDTMLKVLEIQSDAIVALEVLNTEQEKSIQNLQAKIELLELEAER